MSLKPIAAALALALSSTSMAPANALTCDFVNATGDWDDILSWSCGVVPDTNDIANLLVGQTVTVNTVEAIQFLNNAGVVSIESNELGLSNIGGGTTVNSGIINVGGPSTAVLDMNHSVDNTGGDINISDGSLLDHRRGTLTGGTVTATGTGGIRVFSSSANVFDGVVLNTDVDMSTNANSRERVINGLTLNGTVSIDNGGLIDFVGTQTVDGTGVFEFGGNGSNRFDLSGTGTTTLESGITIRGESGVVGQQLSVAGTQVLENNGLISADVSGGTIILRESNVENNNVVEARNGGTLNIDADIINSASGVIRADNGVVIQSGEVITGGTIETLNGGRFEVTSNTINELSGVTVNGDLDMMSVASSREKVTNGLTLNGTIDLDNNAILDFIGTQTVDGNGDIVFGGVGTNNRVDLSGSGTTTFGSGITIRGENGTIGRQLSVSGTQVLQNDGTISADVAGGTITITESAVLNSGTLEAVNGGTLVLDSNVTGAVGSQISVGAGSEVIQTGATISGIINTSGSGKFTASNSSVNFLDGVTLTGNLDLTNTNAQERVTAGGLTLDGQIDIDNGAYLSFEGNGTLDGNATIVFGGAASNDVFLDGSGTTVIASTATIRGENGTIGNQRNIGGTQVLQNDGLISADVSGGTLSISDSAVVNNGTLEAINGGTLVLNTNVTGNTGSQISVGAGSEVIQSGVRISGIINSNGAGSFRATNSSANFLDGVTLNGDLDLASALAQERVTAGGLTLNGQVDIDNGSYLSFEGNGTLDGDATIVLGSDVANDVFLDGSGTTVIASTATIRGENGTIGNQRNIGGTQVLQNDGLISADVTGGTLSISDSAVVNNGTLEAINGGTLVLNTNVTGNAGSQISVGAGSEVIQSGVRISGIINANGAGSFRATNSNANFLDGVTLNGDLDLASALAQERVTAGGLTLNGQVEIDNGSYLSFEGNGTLDGDATIVLGSDVANDVFLDGSGTTVIASTATIRGENGTIGGQRNIGGTQVLQNDGLISADVLGGTLTLRESAVVNNATLEARNGGTLELESAVTNGPSGQILADNGVVLQQGVRITGGVIDSANGGTIQVNNSSVNFLDGVTVNGTLDMATAGISTQRLENGLTLNGRIDADNGARLMVNGGQGVDGTGEIVFGSTGNNLLLLDGSGTTTLGEDLTVRGGTVSIGGQLFVGGTQVLSNLGTIDADTTGGTFTFTQSAITNEGTLRASAGTMDIDVTVTGGGTLEVGPGGQLNLGGASGLAATTGELLHNGNGAGSLDLGLRNVTVSSDYNNANFGTGNAFDARANVAGTGQILASGDVVQGVGGASVTDGTTSAPTLTINNVRVGTTQHSFTVDNNGTVGADLRGAIQTSVNGGNITDTRLGVTDGNFGPVAVGGSSAVQVIDFTVATAGVLAPLVGQQLAIVNNFDNVDGQILSIELGSGATAFNAAIGDTTPTPVIVANQRVNAMGPAQALTVANTAAAGAFTESLNASFGANTGDALNNGGSVSLLAAGASDAGSLAVNVSNTSAGAKSGTVTVDYVSDGTGTSGLESISVGSQVINVSGDVFNVAQADVGPSNIALANQRVSGSASAALSITNTDISPAGFQEGLDAAIGATSGDATATGGPIVNLAQGLGDSASLTVGVDTGTAGAKSGVVTVDLTSNGTISGLADLALASQQVNVSGSVFNAAQADVGPSDIVLANQRVSGTASAALSITNTDISPAGFQEGLDAAIGGTSGDATGAGGPIVNLAQGAGDSSTLTVGVDTGTAGAKSGVVTVDLTSNGTISGLADLALASQQVNVSGSVFNAAQADVGPSDIVLANQRVSGTASAALSITNTDISPAGFQEGLDAAIGGTSGDATGAGGPIVNLAQGAGDSSTLTVGVDTGTAGAKSGVVTVDLTSNGSISGLADLALASQQVNVAGSVFQVAAGQLNTAPLNFGVVQVGQLVTQDLSISNIATGAAGFVEDLNVRFGATSGAGAGLISGAGQIDGLFAGMSDSSSLTVNVDTSAAATVSGAIAVDYFSAGAVNGVSNGLGELGVGSDSFGVSGVIQTVATVIDQAAPVINNPIINLGNVRIGSSSPADNVSVTNVATGNAQADLNASISGNGQVTAAGSFNGLTPGATDSTSLTVGIDTNTAGDKSGTATLAFVSDATSAGCTSNCELALASQDVAVAGAVYRLANGQLDTPSIVLDARRVGEAAASAAVGVSNVSPDAFTEALNVDVTSSTTGFSASGAVAALAAQASDNSSINVALATSTSGDFSGSVDLAYESTGVGTTGAADIAAGGESVEVSGRVYQTAEAVADNTVDFGILRRNTGVQTRNVAVSNVATGALVDEVTGGFVGSAGPFVTSGSLLGVGSGTTDTSSLQAELSTANAGVFSGTGILGLASHNIDMADAALDPLQVAFTAVVNDLAKPVYQLDSGDGTLTGSGNVFNLDFGTTVLGSGEMHSADLSILNDVTGPADFLAGENFAEIMGSGFSSSGFIDFLGVGPGDSHGGLTVSFDSSGLLAGLFSASIVFDASSTLAGGLDAIELGDVTLNIRARIVDQTGNPVPAPATFLLMVAGVVTLLASRRRRTTT